VPPPANARHKSTSSADSTSSSSSSSNSGNVKSVPYNWKSVVIDGGGFVTGIIFSKAKAGVLYIRTDVGGAYRYDPTNRSWIH